MDTFTVVLEIAVPSDERWSTAMVQQVVRQNAETATRKLLHMLRSDAVVTSSAGRVS